MTSDVVTSDEERGGSHNPSASYTETKTSARSQSRGSHSSAASDSTAVSSQTAVSQRSIYSAPSATSTAVSSQTPSASSRASSREDRRPPRSSTDDATATASQTATSARSRSSAASTAVSSQTPSSSRTASSAAREDRRRPLSTTDDGTTAISSQMPTSARSHSSAASATSTAVSGQTATSARSYSSAASTAVSSQTASSRDETTRTTVSSRRSRGRRRNRSRSHSGSYEYSSRRGSYDTSSSPSRGSERRQMSSTAPLPRLALDDHDMLPGSGSSSEEDSGRSVTSSTVTRTVTSRGLTSYTASSYTADGASSQRSTYTGSATYSEAGYSGSYSGRSGYSDGYSGSEYSYPYSRSGSDYTQYSGYSQYSYSGSDVSVDSSGAEVRPMAWVLRRIADKAQLDKAQCRTDMSIVQSARDAFKLPYAPCTMREEVLRIAEHLGWNIVLVEDIEDKRQAAAELLARKQAAVVGALKTLDEIMRRQDTKKEETMQMEMLEDADGKFAQTDEMVAALAASKSMDKGGRTARATLHLARQRLGMPTLDVFKLGFDDFAREAQEICYSFGIELELPSESEDDSSDGSGTQRSVDTQPTVAPTEASTAMSSTASSVKLAVGRMQQRIDGALGSGNLQVIKGVLWDAKHFPDKEKLGYEGPIDYLRKYAKELGMSSSESESDTESDTVTDSARTHTTNSEEGSVIASPLAQAAGEVSPQASPKAKGPKGVDGISKTYDREVAAVAATLSYVQGDERQQKNPDQTLRKHLLMVLPSHYEMEQLKARGLRPVAMGSVTVHGSEDRERTSWVMAIRGTKFYCNVEAKADLVKLLDRVEQAYRTEMERKSTVKARRKEIEGEKRYPRFQRAMVLLLQNPEFPDEMDFRMDLRESVEATLTDIYSQPHPNPERFNKLSDGASPSVMGDLNKVHDAFVESKQRHAAAKSDSYLAAVEEVLRSLPADFDSPEDEDKYRELIRQQLRDAVIDPEPKSYMDLLQTVPASVRVQMDKAAACFDAEQKRMESEAMKKKSNAAWLANLWKGITPDKEEDNEDTKQIRRMKKALARGRRMGVVDRQAIAEEERRDQEEEEQEKQDAEDLKRILDEDTTGGGTCIHVGGLEDNVNGLENETAIATVFGRFGIVQAATLRIRREGKKVSWALVSFRTAEEAEEALEGTAELAEDYPNVVTRIVDEMQVVHSVGSMGEVMRKHLQERAKTREIYAKEARKCAHAAVLVMLSVAFNERFVCAGRRRGGLDLMQG